MNKNIDYTRKMLSLIREGRSNSSTAKKLLTEGDEKTDSKSGAYKILASNPQFGDLRTSQEEELKKTVGEQIEMNDDSLLFFPKKNDSNEPNNLVLSAKVVSLNLTMEFKYVDSMGDGIYIYANGLQLTQENLRTIGKIRQAFENWKNGITSNGDTLAKLENYVKKENDED